MKTSVLVITIVAALLQLGTAQTQNCTPAFNPNSLYIECGCTAEALEQMKQDLKNEISSLKQEILENRVIMQECLGRDCKCQLGKNQDCAASSCKQILENDPKASSGTYWLTACEECNSTEQFCNFNMTCGGTRGWMKVVDFNMNDPTQQCPSTWKLLTSSEQRLCGKSTGQSCNPATFSTNALAYQKVCGKALGHHHKSADGFYRYSCPSPCDIDQPYVDGISITHGQPREHIWSYAAVWTDTLNHKTRCPCNVDRNVQTPSFVGNDYYCEKGNPLWDGQGCSTPDAPCCQNINLPWFYKELSEVTRDDIEIRLCTDQPITDEDILVESIELYVQ